MLFSFAIKMPAVKQALHALPPLFRGQCAEATPLNLSKPSRAAEHKAHLGQEQAKKIVA
jgi:hypothetical protein